MAESPISSVTTTRDSPSAGAASRPLLFSLDQTEWPMSSIRTIRSLIAAGIAVALAGYSAADVVELSDGSRIIPSSCWSPEDAEFPPSGDTFG